MRNISLIFVLIFSLILSLSGCQSLSNKSASTAIPKKPVSHTGSDNSDDVIGRITEDVKNADEAIAKGEKYLALEKQDTAMVYFIKALQFDEHNIKALEYIAVLHYQKGNNQYAKQLYTQILSIDGNHVIANEQLGLINLIERNIPLAKQYLLKSISLNNKQWKSQNGLGIIADIESRYSEAIEHYQNALAVAPSNPILFNNVGYSYYLSGNDYEAEKNYKNALQLNSKYKRAIDNLALLKIKHQQYSAAISLLNTVMEPYETYNSVGYLCMVHKQYQQADLYFHKAIKESPYYYPKAVENLKNLNDLHVKSQSLPKIIVPNPKSVTNYTAEPVINNNPATITGTTTPATSSADNILLPGPEVSAVNIEKKNAISSSVKVSSPDVDTSTNTTTIIPDDTETEVTAVRINQNSTLPLTETVVIPGKLSLDNSVSQESDTKTTSSVPSDGGEATIEKKPESTLPENSVGRNIIDNPIQEKNHTKSSSESGETVPISGKTMPEISNSGQMNEANTLSGSTIQKTSKKDESLDTSNDLPSGSKRHDPKHIEITREKGF